MAKFTIESNLVISPKSAAKEIYDILDLAYNSRGNDESQEEFVNRIIEEFILGIYRQRSLSDAASLASEQRHLEIEKDATIRKRKDKLVDTESAAKPRKAKAKKGEL